MFLEGAVIKCFVIYSINKINHNIIKTKQIYYKNESGDTNVQQSLWRVECFWSLFLQGVLPFHFRSVR